MSAFQREQRRMLWAGIKLTGAIDDLPPGKYGFAQNVRSYEPDQITSRFGLTQIPGSNLANPITGLDRFDDPTPFATNPHLYVIGGGANLYTSVVGSGVFNNVDTGYSGSPLSFVSATPPQAAQPWLYVFDRSRVRKLDANGHVFRQGIAPPTVPPTASLQQLGVTVVTDFNSFFVPFTLVGAATGPILSPDRVFTSVFAYLFDGTHGPAGGPGYVSIIPVSMAGFNPGMNVQLFFEADVTITDVFQAIPSTVVAAILYDAGNTGFCTIQPLGSIAVGQLEAPTPDDYAARYLPTPGGVPPEPGPLAAANARIRQVDFVVNALVEIGSEIVRIESVALGADGIQSFRCFTNNPHLTGEALTGVGSLRAWVNQPFHVPGDSIRDTVQEHDLPAGTDVVGGLRSGAGFPAVNMAMIAGRATLPGDIIDLAFQVSLPSQVQTVRMYLSANPTGGSAPSDNDFLQNYFFFEWRSNDIQAAVQAANAAAVNSLQNTRFTAVGNAQINQDLSVDVAGVIGDVAGAGSGAGTAAQAGSQMLQLGNNQWMDLKCKVSDLQRVGTDPTLTLASITAVEVLVHATGPNIMVIDWDSISLQGGFGADAGVTAIPYVFMYRYRSSLTGATSNFSPPLRGGVNARRQRIALTHTASADPQADLVDWFVLGATLSRWTYCGTVSSGQTFNYDLSDSSVSGGDQPSYDNFPPWPTQDGPKKGTCNIVGNAIQWASGDQFNTNWAPGSEIIISELLPAKGGTYTLYSQPPSATLLFTNENIGNQNNVPFTIKGATLLNQNMATAWGGPIAGATFIFACGDPINPGTVHWTNPNDPETASEKNSLDVTSPDEPLQGGFMDDGIAYVASTERIIRLEPTFGQGSTFLPLETNCHRGFWTNYTFDRGLKGWYFLTRDGIATVSGGNFGGMITDADLYPLFPHDGQPGVAVNGIQPPDMTQPALYLSCNDGWVYFDYKDILGAFHTLAYRELDGAWHYDTYGVGITARQQASGQLVHQMLIGGTNGKAYLPSGTTDDGAAISAQLQWVQDQGDARRQKLYRDLMLDGQNLNPVSVTIGFSNNAVTIGPTSLAGSGAGRTQQQVDSALQTGNFGTNLTTLVTWTPGATPTILYVWDIAFQPAPELATSWLSGPTTHGFRAFQQVYQVLVPLISNSQVTLSLIVDGVAKTYTLPSTGGIYAKIPVILQSVKGLTFQYGLNATTPFMLFDQDFESWVSVWGTDGDYQIVRPF